MDVSRLTVKHQVTVPADVRAALGLKAGDHVAFEVENGRAVLRRAEPIDRAWAAAVGSALTEWSEDEDEDAWRDL